MADELLDALHELTARPDSTFRAGQREAIEALAYGRERVLLVQRTGWGKSAVYFVTTHLLRKAGAGPTHPLLAPMFVDVKVAAYNRRPLVPYTGVLDQFGVDDVVIDAPRLLCQ
jgi:ATP-dependent DNA helicase RecQ